MFAVRLHPAIPRQAAAKDGLSVEITLCGTGRAEIMTDVHFLISCIGFMSQSSVEGEVKAQAKAVEQAGEEKLQELVVEDGEGRCRLS